MSSLSSSAEPAPSALKRAWGTYSQNITASLEVKKQQGHLLVLDGVRAIACLAVVLHHMLYHVILPAGIWHPSGSLQVVLAALLDFGGSAVILFFLLSSFLLFLPFARALLLDNTWPSLSRFYLRRFLRILPGYYAAILLMVLFFHPEFLHADHIIDILEFFTFSMHAGLPDQINVPFWTMAVEFQFYLLLPLIAWVCSLLVRRGTLHWRLIKLTGYLLFLLGWGLLSRWWGLSTMLPTTPFPQNVLAALQPYYYGDNGKYFECFAVGMWLATLYVFTHQTPQGERWRLRFQRWSPWLFATGVLLLSVLSFFAFFTSGEYPHTFAFLDAHRSTILPLYAQWQSLGYAIGYGLGMGALLYTSGRLRRPFEWIVFRWIGLFSFSLYMWHYPLLLLFEQSILHNVREGGKGLEFLALCAWVCMVILPLSLTLYRWFELPGMRLGEWLIRKQEARRASVTVPQTPPQPPLTDLADLPTRPELPALSEQADTWYASSMGKQRNPIQRSESLEKADKNSVPHH